MNEFCDSDKSPILPVLKVWSDYVILPIYIIIIIVDIWFILTHQDVNWIYLHLLYHVISFFLTIFRCFYKPKFMDIIRYFLNIGYFVLWIYGMSIGFHTMKVNAAHDLYIFIFVWTMIGFITAPSIFSPCMNMIIPDVYSPIIWVFAYIILKIRGQRDTPITGNELLSEDILRL